MGVAMKLTKDFIMQLIKEEVAEAKAKGKMGAAQDMLRMVLQDGGDEKVLERVRALFGRMTDIEKTQFVQMLVKAVTGNDLADATLKQSIRQGDK
jgi:hypothetical protein